MAGPDGPLFYLTPRPAASDPLEAACAAACRACKAGGNVLIPTSPWGCAFALIEALADALLAAALPHVPIYVVSPVASNSALQVPSP